MYDSTWEKISITLKPYSQYQCSIILVSRSLCSYVEWSCRNSVHISSLCICFTWVFHHTKSKSLIQCQPALWWENSSHWHIAGTPFHVHTWLRRKLAWAGQELTLPTLTNPLWCTRMLMAWPQSPNAKLYCRNPSSQFPAAYVNLMTPMYQIQSVHENA